MTSDNLPRRRRRRVDRSDQDRAEGSEDRPVVAEELPVGPDAPEDPRPGPGRAPAGAVVEPRPEGPTSRPIFEEVEERPDGPRWAPTEVDPVTGKPAKVVEAESRLAADQWDEMKWGRIG